VCILNCAYLVV